MKRLLPFIFIIMTFTACTFQPSLVEKKIDFSSILPLAERSLAIYSLSDQELKANYPDIAHIQVIRPIDVRYVLETDHVNKRHLITIRGTANIANALQDAEFIASKNDKLDIYVHHGFDTDTQAVYTSILPKLDPDYSVQITGHSLGAAIASLLMIYLYHDGFTLEATANFGQPKFTNIQGVQKYRFLPVLRVVDANDIVPLVPPITLLDPIQGIYEHISAEVTLLDKQYYTYLSRHQSERISTVDFWTNLLGDASVNDHNMQYYIDRIKEKLAFSVQVPYSQREQYLNDQHIKGTLR